ncbi:MAG: hypothetical protein KDA61_02095 [Planctomycetales bacterium]|nr:hypothetical protein [Planctomycetales bacterium]
MSQVKSTPDALPAPAEASLEAGVPFVGQWNNLVSTTNWEKGRIICEWREALMADGAPVTDYSDEAWAQLVGGVTSQHVGRLRRVFQRFGENFEQYPALFWSHFQAAIDWEDAEMWLEGAIHNGWSVSQMRGKRWETHGSPDEPLPAEQAAEEPEGDIPAESIAAEEAAAAQAGPETTAVKSVDEEEKAKASKKNDEEEDDHYDDGTEATAGPTSPGEGEMSQTAAPKRRLPVEVDELPDDIAEAFEQFKLAIIAHRREGWSETTPEDVLECLDALKQLVEQE